MCLILMVPKRQSVCRISPVDLWNGPMKEKGSYLQLNILQTKPRILLTMAQTKVWLSLWGSGMTFLGSSTHMINFHSKTYHGVTHLHSTCGDLLFTRFVYVLQSSVEWEINSVLQQSEKSTLNFSRVSSKLRPMVKWERNCMPFL